MKAVLTAVIAAIEAAAVALAVFVAIAAPALLVWWLTFDLAAEPSEVASIIASVWQLSHLVPLQIAVSPEAALGLGLEAAAIDFTVSLAPLGLTLVTGLLAFRSGWRFSGRGGSGGWAVFGGILGFAAAALLVALIPGAATLWPLWQLGLVPALVYALPLGLGFVLRAVLEGQGWWPDAVRGAQRFIARIAPLSAAVLPERTGETMRLAIGGLVALFGLAGLGTAVAILVAYVDIVALSQSLQLDIYSAIMLFLLQLVLLPVTWVWGIAWFAGPGFSIGTATSVTPFETLLGPLPALPLFGAIPQGWGWAGGIAPALVVAIAAALGGFSAGRPAMRRSSTLTAVFVPLTASAIVGLAVALLGMLANGSIGPGRLAEVGPSAWLVGGFVALEFAFGMTLGVFARRVDVDRLREAAPSIPAMPDLLQRGERGEGGGKKVGGEKSGEQAADEWGSEPEEVVVKTLDGLSGANATLAEGDPLAATQPLAPLPSGKGLLKSKLLKSPVLPRIGAAKAAAPEPGSPDAEVSESEAPKTTEPSVFGDLARDSQPPSSTKT